MNSERWIRIEALLEAALDRPAPERAAYLRDACGDDETLRQEVEGLLPHAGEDGGFLDRPLVRLGDIATPPPVDGVPDRIGPYTVVRQLGRGGMGEVYLAVHRTEDLEQQVALKIIRAGRGSEEVLRRFRLERRILATLRHTNIARLLDAGATTDGRPYFVMEYVPGRPIDDYCREQRLSIEARVRLCQIVCGAVQHAHQHLVVHRDIKPGNILVGDDGVPKLLDFGIGKVLDDSDSFGSAVETTAGIRLLTPEYAAPEQILGQPVTTATDVHGLGVLLFELLSGRHPFRPAEPASARQIERAIIEQPSPGLGLTEASALAGDLDNIVGKALRKEPARRYSSPAALAEDLGRLLSGRPVSARPDTFGYRVRKFVRRNAAAVAASALAVAALVTTVVVTLVQLRRVEAESLRVRQERDKLAEVRGFLMEMFGATGADRAVGDTVTARQLLDLQAAQAGVAFAGRPDLEGEMLEVLADGYDRLGLLPEAERLASAALDLKRATLGGDHPDLASTLNLVGWIRHEMGRSREAESVLVEATAVRRRAGDGYRRDLARSLNDLGVVRSALGKMALAESVLAEALAIRRAEFGDGHRAVGITASNLASVFYNLSRLDEAVPLQRLAVDVLSGTVGPSHQRTLIALTNLATFQYVSGDLAAAEASYRDVLERQIALRGRGDPQTAVAMTSLATAISARAAASGSDSALGEAESLVREALAATEARLGPDHPQVAEAEARVSSVLMARGRPEDALPRQARALAIYRRAYGPEHARSGASLAELARIRWRMGRAEDALALLHQAVEILDRTAGPTHPASTEAQGSLCSFLAWRPVDARRASEACGRVVAHLSRAPAGQARHLAYYELRLAKGMLDIGNTAAADSIVRNATERVEAGAGGRGARPLLDSLKRALGH